MAKDMLAPGTEVIFLVRSFHGEEEYKDLSEKRVVHQAVAVRPYRVFKVALEEENYKKCYNNL